MFSETRNSEALKQARKITALGSLEPELCPCNDFASLRSKRFRLVSGQRNTEEGDFRF